MLLRVKACSVCKHLRNRRWEELRRVGQSWEGESWDELRKRWGDLSGGKKRWEELRRVRARWAEVRVVEKSWEEQGRGEKSWVEVGRDETTLRAVEKSCENGEELRSGGHNWKGVRQSDDEFTEQSWEAVRVRCISYRQTLSLDPIASQFLNLETSAIRLARGLLVWMEVSIQLTLQVEKGIWYKASHGTGFQIVWQYHMLHSGEQTREQTWQ